MVKVPKALKNLQNCGEKLDCHLHLRRLDRLGKADQYVKFKGV